MIPLSGISEQTRIRALNAELKQQLIKLQAENQQLKQQNQVLVNCWDEAQIRATKAQDKYLNEAREVEAYKAICFGFKRKIEELKNHLNPVEE